MTDYTKTTKKAKNGIKGVIQFEPCAAPLTKKRGLKESDEKPTFSLRHPDGQIFVYGVDDCLNHGDSDNIIRLNSFERYGDDDYLDMMKVQWLHLFADHRGGNEIAPTGVISVPISLYNKPEDLQAFKNKIVGKYQLEDAAGCQLKIRIDEKKLLCVPESSGAFYHYTHDLSGEKRGMDFDASGNVLVVDVGYLTTDISLYINEKYQRNNSKTENVGMSSVVLPIHEALSGSGKKVDISQIDAGLRLIAGAEPGPKHITIAGAYRVDVGPIYDPQLMQLAKALRDVILNKYKGYVAIIILTGGGAFHLLKLLSDLLPIPVVVCPDAALSNCVGAFIRLRNEATKKGAADSLVFSVDGGNGGFKGISSSTI